MSHDLTGCGDLAQEQTEPGDHEAEAHQGQARPHPGKERPFSREPNPWVLGLLFLFLPDVVLGLGPSVEVAQRGLRGRNCRPLDHSRLPRLSSSILSLMCRTFGLPAGGLPTPARSTRSAT